MWHTWRAEYDLSLLTIYFPKNRITNHVIGKISALAAIRIRMWSHCEASVDLLFTFLPIIHFTSLHLLLHLAAAHVFNPAKIQHTIKSIKSLVDAGWSWSSGYPVQAALTGMLRALQASWSPHLVEEIGNLDFKAYEDLFGWIEYNEPAKAKKGCWRGAITGGSRHTLLNSMQEDICWPSFGNNQREENNFELSFSIVVYRTAKPKAPSAFISAYR